MANEGESTDSDEEKIASAKSQPGFIITIINSFRVRCRIGHEQKISIFAASAFILLYLSPTPPTKFVTLFLSHSAPNVFHLSLCLLPGGNHLSAILLSSEGSLPKTCLIHFPLRALIMLVADSIGTLCHSLSQTKLSPIFSTICYRKH